MNRWAIFGCPWRDKDKLSLRRVPLLCGDSLRSPLGKPSLSGLLNINPWSDRLEASVLPTFLQMVLPVSHTAGPYNQGFWGVIGLAREVFQG